MTKIWKEKTLLMKFLFVVRLITSSIALVLATLQLVGVLENAACLYIPLIGVTMIIQAAEYMKKDKTVAYISLGAAVFIFAVTIFILLNWVF